MTVCLTVALPAGAYDITIGSKLLMQAGDILRPLVPSPRVIVISDEHVAKYYLHRLTNALAQVDIRVAPVIIPPGEASKSLGHFSAVLEQVLALEPDRKTTVIALGGGVVGDLAGFVASVVLRGLPFIQIPTTLLAQVDSSVGGKTGINTVYGKNVVGAFYQPKAVVIDVDTLATLPPREMRAGYAEIVKYGLINDAPFFNWLEQHGKALLDGDVTLQIEAIQKSCAAKAAIVAADEKETNDVRALLNLGHTFAHALEAECGFSEELLHGEAVAIGLVLAFKLSASLGCASAKDAARIEQHFARVGINTDMRKIPRPLDADALLAHMRHDKKAEQGSLVFVLAKAIGESFVARGIAAADVHALLSKELA